jgi:hypothetical protein
MLVRSESTSIYKLGGNAGDKTLRWRRSAREKILVYGDINQWVEKPNTLRLINGLKSERGESKP